MDLVFTKAGKYRNGVNVLEVTEDHVKDNSVLTVVAENGVNYVAKGLAKMPVAEKKLTKEEVEKLTLPKLKDYAEQKKIDLGDAEKKPDVLEAVLKALFSED